MAERLSGPTFIPGVNPPFCEELSRSNMYPGNLTRDAEAAKLAELTAAIEQSFGNRPLMYKAGRYGVGPNSSDILEEQGFEVDLSVCPPWDHSADGGPDFSAARCEPYWFGNTRQMLEIPISGAYVGWLGGLSDSAYRVATTPSLQPLRLPGILARLRAVDRLMLSPEGHTFAEHTKLTQFLLDQGVRTFTWSFSQYLRYARWCPLCEDRRRSRGISRAISPILQLLF